MTGNQTAELENAPSFWRSLTSFTIIPWLYVFAIALAEMLVGLVDVKAGLFLHFVLLFLILVHAVLLLRSEASKATSADIQGHRFYLAMTLAPLIRILSLSMPLANFPLMYWYMIVGIPLFAGAFVVIRLAGYDIRDICLVINKLPLQLAICLLGLPLGLMEFYILHPSPLVRWFLLEQMLLPAFILLVFTGFAEELIFRGILQKAAVDYLGSRTAFYFVSSLFAVLHITHLSVLDVFFVFGVAMLFALLVKKTNSILGVTLAHGLTNITLYLVWPFLL